MQEINAWLLKKDFEQGKLLYIKYGTNSFFKTLLQSGPTPFNVKKLGVELTALAPVSPAKQDAPQPQIDEHRPPVKLKGGALVTAAAAHQLSVISKPTTKSPANLPKYLELKELLKNTYRQLERNMAELDISENESYLHLSAKNILSLDQKKRDIYKLLDYYDEHECFPDVKQKVIRTPTEEIQLLMQSTSKAKTRLKSPKCRDIEATRQLIENNNKRISELRGESK
jgi:hypothetical protein